MNSNNIYSILASKPHNEHYLKRYFKFIRWCQENPTTENYTEKHHICPKSKDLFPEYSDFNQNKWNLVILSTRQHIMAHIFLWKAYGGDQVIPVNYMLNVQNSDTAYNNRKIPTAIQIRYSANAKKSFNHWRKGKATYKDSEGNKYFLETDDPKILELNLVGYISGHTHSDESKQKMSDTKYPNKVITLYMLNHKVVVKQFSEEFDSYISQGWTTEYLEEDKNYSRKEGDKKNSEFWTGRMRYMDSSGVYHGSYLHTDPIIKELNLKPLRTDAQITQNASRTALATEAKLGTQIYNNGAEERFLHEPIDSTWVLGRLPRSDEWESKRTAASKAAVIGSKTYTNGIINMFIKPDEVVPEGFYLGMKFRDGVTYYYVNPDKTEIISFVGKHTIPQGYSRIKEREAKVIMKRT